MSFINNSLKRKLKEIYFIAPNDLGLGFLNLWYKRLTSYLKTAPFLVIFPLSLVTAIISYLLLNRLLVNLVSLLQYGF